MDKVQPVDGIATDDEPHYFRLSIEEESGIYGTETDSQADDDNGSSNLSHQALACILKFAENSELREQLGI